MKSSVSISYGSVTSIGIRRPGSCEVLCFAIWHIAQDLTYSRTSAASPDHCHLWRNTLRVFVRPK